MTKKIIRQITEFEQEHGQPKIDRLKRQLDAERRKVESLAGVQNRITVTKINGDTFRFALCGDFHVGSLYWRPDACNAFVDYCLKSGVKEFYHTGDVLDGHRVYRGQEFELRDVGLDAQLDRFARDVPDVTTHFITGNHDQSFKTLAGVPVGKEIEARKTQWRFHGEEQARFQWHTRHGDFMLMLIHPGGGTSYALSYRPQKIVESLEGGTKPNLLGIGHYHKAEYMPSYRNVSVFQTGTFQRQTPFMARHGLAAHVGGWLVEVTVGEHHNIIRSEFVAFY